MKYTQSAIAFGVTLALSAPVLAQETTEEKESGLERITVTAQKRAQTIDEVPATVSAIPAETVNDYLGASENIRGLAGRVPSLQIESSNGRVAPRFYIRGLGNTDFDTNANQPVAMVVDEVFLENAVLKGLPLFDLSRVEVLNGPQGTLFGRNTPAGIVKIDTQAPLFENSGYVKGGFGSRSTYFLETAINRELNENWATRISIKYTDRDDWIDNVTRNEEIGGFDEFAYRLQFLYDNNETRILFKLHGYDQETTLPQAFYANAIELGREGLRPGFDEEVYFGDAASGGSLDHFGGSLKIEHDFGDYQFTSVTGYDTLDNFQFTDVDGGNTAFPPVASNTLGQQLFFNVSSGDGLSDHYQFNQEFRISAELDNLFYQAGVYYFKEDITVVTRDTNLEGGQSATGAFGLAEQVTTSHAIFGQVEYSVSDEFVLTGGLRYTDDDKELDIVNGFNNEITDEIDLDDSFINWDISGRYTINENITSFVRIATASRGPVTIGRFGLPSQADTEDLISYEIGLKTEFFDNNLRWNITAYTFDVDEQQLTATGGEANTNTLLNIDEVEGRGVETDLEAILSDEFRIVFNASWNDTEIKEPGLLDDACTTNPECTVLDPVVDVVPSPFGGTIRRVDINGNPLPRAPKWLANLTLNYETRFKDGFIYAQADANYRSDSNIFLYESVEFVAESRTLVGVRAGYKMDNGLDIAIVGRNITDEVVVDGAIDFLNLTAFVNEPQFWGIEVGYEF